jgi:hypothetical protein
MESFFANFENTVKIFNEESIINKYKNLINKLEILENENLNLKENITLLENQIKTNNKEIEDKNDELASYKKSSLIVSMNKQVNEQKTYISILEKQLKNLKNNNEIVNEVIKNTDKEDLIDIKESVNENVENKEEYETIEFKNKKYYLIKKKVYRINKDKSLGECYGKYKNGEIIKNT